MRTAIQSAVDGVLKTNGIDPTKMPHGPHRHGGMGAASAAFGAQGNAMQDQLLKILGGPTGDADGSDSDAFSLGATSGTLADPTSSSSTSAPRSDALGDLLQTFLKNSLPGGSLLNVLA